MLRVRPIRLPQLGHKCFEVSPSMVEIVTSRADHAVMAVTVDRDFWQGRRSASPSRAARRHATCADDMSGRLLTQGSLWQSGNAEIGRTSRVNACKRRPR